MPEGHASWCRPGKPCGGRIGEEQKDDAGLPLAIEVVVRLPNGAGDRRWFEYTWHPGTAPGCTDARDQAAFVAEDIQHWLSDQFREASKELSD